MRSELGLAVVMPTNRVDGWLDIAVQSVLDDIGPHDALIVAHDGVAIDITRPWHRDSRVICTHSGRNLGVAQQLSLAFGQSDAKYLGRLDADDINCTGRFAAQSAYLDAHPDVVLTASEATRISPEGAELGAFGSAAGEDIRRSLIARNRIVHSSVMIRAQSYRSAGGYNPSLRQMEDYDLWLRMGCVGRISALPASLVKYRLHRGQVSRGAKPIGMHIDSVNRARMALGTHLGITRSQILRAQLKWHGAQALRYWGVRKPRYDQTAPS